MDDGDDENDDDDSGVVGGVVKLFDFLVTIFLLVFIDLFIFLVR